MHYIQFEARFIIFFNYNMLLLRIYIYKVSQEIIAHLYIYIFF